MQSATRLQAVQIPAGTYAVGDPCQLLNDPDFEELEAANPDTLNHTLDRGLTLTLLPVAGGDGWLEDDQGGQYAIDTGHLAVVPLSDPVPLQIVEAAARGVVQLYTFRSEVLVASAGKLIKVGGVTITRQR